MSNIDDEIDSTTGNYLGNRVLGWSPIEFAVEFIYRMRDKKTELFETPSARQAISIPKLLSAIYYRKSVLIPQDFIKAAVITTPIEDQKTAEEVAFDILFPMKGDKVSGFFGGMDKLGGVGGEKSLSPGKSGKGEGGKPSEDPFGSAKEFVEDLASDLSKLGISLNDLQNKESLKDKMNETQQMLDFVDDLYNKAQNGTQPQKALTDIIDSRGSYNDVLSKGINNLEDLKDYAKQQIQRDISQLSPKDIEASVELGFDDMIKEQSKAPWEKITADYQSLKQSQKNGIIFMTLRKSRRDAVRKEQNNSRPVGTVDSTR